MSEIYINDKIKNKYNNSPFRIPLRNKDGIIVEYSLVDEDDFEKVNKYKWSLLKGKYAQGKVNTITYRLHKYIFGSIQNGKVLDHINNDGLDNRKCNLREVTHSINNQNASNKNDKTTSIYIGVRTADNRFKVACQHKHLGYYDDEMEAAKMYDIYSYKIFGKDALNNRLVSFEEAIKLDDTIYNFRDSKFMENELPDNVYYAKRENAYYARKNFRTKKYRGLYRKTIPEALNDIIEINVKINKLKLFDELYHYFREITKDENSMAYIFVNDIKIYVDELLWHKFASMKWAINPDGYTINWKLGLIHRIVTNAKKDELVDHINKDKNDNRLENLRIVKAGENNHNKLKQTNKSSKYIGVSLNKRYNKWQSEIKHQNKRYHLGSFSDERQAAEAYNKKAIELYGDFANLNMM